MCGRYQFTVDEIEDFWRAAREIIAEMERKEQEVKTGEVYPTNRALVMTADGPAAMTWGFPHFKGSGVIINAKSETVTEKRMFRDSVIGRRCIIPTTGFYEWGPEEDGQQSLFGTAPKARNGKTKYIFRLPGAKVLYLAGCYKQFGDEEEPRFVVLTTAANTSMEAIHNRMPVVLRPEERLAWLQDGVDFDPIILYLEIK